MEDKNAAPVEVNEIYPSGTVHNPIAPDTEVINFSTEPSPPGASYTPDAHANGGNIAFFIASGATLLGFLMIMISLLVGDEGMIGVVMIGGTLIFGGLIASAVLLIETKVSSPNSKLVQQGSRKNSKVPLLILLPGLILVLFLLMSFIA